MFSLILNVVGSVLHLYCTWRIGSLPMVRRRYPCFIGHYHVGGMQLIVGRGAGTWGARMRLWQPVEILHITLRIAGVHLSP
ncbi:MAG: hypothetical protein ACQEQN_07040 [Thermodesulfobacteriota bacterium]